MDMVMIQKLLPIFFFFSSFSLCCYCFLLTLFLAADPASSSSSSGSSTYTPLDNYLIKCGGGQANLTLDNRIWQADTTIANLLSSSDSSSSSIEASIVGSPIPLLNTSRIFTRTESYSFPVSSPGPHWLRLYFYSFSYRNFTEAAATFSVVAVSGPSQYTLLHDFNPASSSSSAKLIPSPSYLGNYTGFFFKEYTINITSSPFLLTFIPSQGPDAYAFINAIEFISAPPELIPEDPYLLGSSSLSPIGASSMAIETMYRINVGGPLVSPTNDTSGLYRTWLPNESYLDSSLGVAEINSTLDSIMYTQSGSDERIAPPIVYSTALQIDSQQETASVGFNLSWDLAVQPNFTYVVRFHLCELQYSTGGKRYFNLYLQNQSAYSQLDLGQMYEEYAAIHMDFTVPLAEDSSNLRVQAGPPPNVGSYVFTEAIVNGIEVWKLSNSEGSLDGVSEHLMGASRATNSKTSLAPIVGGAVGGAVAAFALVMAIVCLCCRQRAKVVVKQPASTWVPLTLMHEGHSASVVSKATVAGSYASSAPSTMAGRVFTFAEILEATRNFDEALVIGVGGFGKVYQAHLDDGTKVAIKRGNPRSEQGIMEFQTEIDMLSKLRHRHLVSLIGYCNENHEMVLVYEFMANGPLRSHLYGTNLPPLSWKQRLEICVGAARGLHYLHTGAMRCIIHRDVKTTNILLDENLVAKVSDFGLSKTGPDLDQSHVSTAVKGSFGYLDPEYFRRQQLTDKSDVYSLGVVLMEVICARPAINPTLPREQVNMAEWAMHWQRKGMLEEVMDPNLAGNICRDSLDIFGKTAEKCLAEDGASRPTMGQVLWSLEYALQLQDRSLLGAMSTTNMDNEEGHTNNVVVLPRLDEEEENHRVEEEHEHEHDHDHDHDDDDDDTEDISMSAVFSQMVRPH